VSSTPAEVYYAGSAFRTHGSRRGVPGTYLGSQLTQAAKQVARRTADGRRP